MDMVEISCIPFATSKAIWSLSFHSKTFGFLSAKVYSYAIVCASEFPCVKMHELYLFG